MSYPNHHDAKEAQAALAIPDYLSKTYHWAYINPKNIKNLDQNWVYQLILLGQGQRLLESSLKEIPAGANMLQVAHVYGNLLSKVAEKLTDRGQLTLIDIVPAQLARAAEKLKNFKNINLQHRNAAAPFPGDPAIIGIYFLLHEVPDTLKQNILNNALDCLDQGAQKIILVDYHRPLWFSPTRGLLWLVLSALEPYAKSLWQQEIQNFSLRADAYHWQKETYFFNTYQKVVVTAKSSL